MMHIDKGNYLSMIEGEAENTAEEQSVPEGKDGDRS